MEKLESNRMGLIIPQQSGYSAYIPKMISDGSLELKLNPRIYKVLSEADMALGELKGVTDTLPNPDLFVAYYVKKEALLSSQIEGTECSLDEVLEIDEGAVEVKPVHEVVNYIKAMNFGLEEQKNIPMSIRLLHKIHKILLEGVRGKNKYPGEFKKSQNWIGPSGCNLKEAIYVPPPPSMMIELVGDFEKYYHIEKELPSLIEVAIMHSQFETIHPYVDGNGRLGRLLVTFMLCEKKILDRPILYLSLFFKENRDEYYRLLMDVRFKGKIEEWIEFFLRGVRNTSLNAIETAKEIKRLMEKHTMLINDQLLMYSMSIPMYDFICKYPIFTIPQLSRNLNSTYPTIKSVVQKFRELGMIGEYEKRGKTMYYSYSEYLEILRRGTE